MVLIEEPSFWSSFWPIVLGAFFGGVAAYGTDRLADRRGQRQEADAQIRLLVEALTCVVDDLKIFVRDETPTIETARDDALLMAVWWPTGSWSAFRDDLRHLPNAHVRLVLFSAFARIEQLRDLVELRQTMIANLPGVSVGPFGSPQQRLARSANELVKQTLVAAGFRDAIATVEEERNRLQRTVAQPHR